MLQGEMTDVATTGGLSDAQLVEALSRLAAAERKAIALLVATLAEFDARGLYRGLGYSSLFDYCTRALRLSEQAAYTRIEAARLSRRFPQVIDCIEKGELSLTAARLLAPHLTADNCAELLRRASGQKTRDVERIVAAVRPLPAVPSMIRKLPDAPAAAGPGRAALPVPAAPTLPPARRAVVQPLSPVQYRLQITMSARSHDKLREAQRLMRHSVPTGDPARIVDRALDLLLAHLRKTKFGETNKPRPPRGEPSGRHIPKAVKREVWKRDGARCAFVTRDGRRCEERESLEFHHVTPYARGGPSTVVNIELRCRTHNAYEAELAGLPFTRY